MSQHTFDVAPPSPFNPGPPPWQPIERPRRRWAAVLAAAAAGAVTASVAAAVVTVQTRDTTTQPPTPAAVTETVPAPTPAAPTPWPTTQADRHICTVGNSSSGAFLRRAQAQMALLPDGLQTDDPTIVDDPHWQSVLADAGSLYRQAGDALADEIPPGATPMLSEAATTMVAALHFLGDTTADSDLVYASGSAGTLVNKVSDELGALCDRLAP